MSVSIHIVGIGASGALDTGFDVGEMIVHRVERQVLFSATDRNGCRQRWFVTVGFSRRRLTAFHAWLYFEGVRCGF